MKRLFFISLCFLSVLKAQENEPTIKELCNPTLQHQILIELMTAAPTDQEIAKAAEYILFVRCVFLKKGIPVPSIESFCEEFKKEYPNDEIARRLSEELMKKKDLDPESFFLQINGFSVENNPYFEDAVNDCMWGLGELVISIFCCFLGQYSGGALSAGQAYRDFNSSYHKMEKAAEYERAKKYQTSRTDRYSI